MERVKKSWGYYEVLDKGDGFLVKKLVIRPGQRTSYQYHKKRDEYWYVVEGIANIRYDDYEFQSTKFEEVYVPKKTRHQIINKQSKNLKIVEFWRGNSTEEDIVRLK